MNRSTYRNSERGSAGIKFLIIIVAIGLIANAGFNYIPVAYNGANFKQEMDTAVVKGLATAGAMKPLEVVTAHVHKAAAENGIPPEAVFDIKMTDRYVQAHVAYQQKVDLIPFGIYRYNYDFDYTATPKGYLMKD